MPAVGTAIAFTVPVTHNTPNQMKTPSLKKSQFSLGDLIMAVSSCSKNNREAVAAVADLLETGKVRLNANGRKVRARVY